MYYRTGFEEMNDDFQEVEMIAGCPVTGLPVAVEICRNGPRGLRPCAYFLALEKRERGGDREPKQVLICGAPRGLPVSSGFLPRNQVVIPTREDKP